MHIIVHISRLIRHAQGDSKVRQREAKGSRLGRIGGDETDQNEQEQEPR
jgi:hypothetical protein